MKHTLALATAIVLSTLSAHAIAGQPFLRAEAGSSDVEVSVDGYRGSDEDTVLTIGGGYWFTPNVAIEGHIGTLYSEYLGGDTDLDLISVGAGVVAKKNFGPDNTGFFIGGRAGIARMTAQVREEDFDVVDDESSTKPYFGVTAGYDFNRRWGLSLNYDRRSASFDGLDVDVDTVSLAGEFRFR